MTEEVGVFVDVPVVTTVPDGVAVDSNVAVAVGEGRTRVPLAETVTVGR